MSHHQQKAGVQNIAESGTSLLYHHFNLFNNLNECKYVPLLCWNFLTLAFASIWATVSNVGASDRFHALLVERKMTKMAPTTFQFDSMPAERRKSNITLILKSKIKCPWNMICYLDRISSKPIPKLSVLMHFSTLWTSTSCLASLTIYSKMHILDKFISLFTHSFQLISPLAK